MNNDTFNYFLKRFMYYNILLKPTKYTAGMEKYLYNRD